jgi:hypothetical protein
VLDGIVYQILVFRRKFAWIDTREALSNPYQVLSARNARGGLRNLLQRALLAFVTRQAALVTPPVSFGD